MASKSKIILIPAIFILWLTLLWSINIRRIYYELTPWKNLGSPPAKALVLLRVDFSYSYPFEQNQPIIYVYAEDRKTYNCCFSSIANHWGTGEHSLYAFSDYEKDDKVACAEQLKQEWQLKDEEFSGAKDSIVQGECVTYGSDKLALVQIKQDGTVWEKYINEGKIQYLREEISFYTGLLLFLYILRPTRFFKNIDLLALTPDYNAK